MLKKKKGLSHIAFVVLGLISEENSHGKIIDEKIQKRGMRDWTNIGKSSLYGVLKKLESDGLVQSWIEECDNRMIRVYKITSLGISTLKNKIRNVIYNYKGRNDEDFYVAFSMFPYLSEKEQLLSFSNALERTTIHKKELEDMLKLNRIYPINVTGLFKHPIMVLQTNIEFLKWVIEEIKNGGGKFDPEAYNK
ncbi:MAG: PadR family transcriptional regulator [Candidatus Lokiarchaeota archaeon]|nr:PadR family transcriptional regulator [Candidatus Lokiarchaeota archaeon]